MSPVISDLSLMTGFFLRGQLAFCPSILCLGLDIGAMTDLTEWSNRRVIIVEEECWMLERGGFASENTLM